MRNPDALLALLIVSASLPSLASAQRNDARFSACFALGLGGEADVETDGGLGDFEANLDATEVDDTDVRIATTQAMLNFGGTIVF